MIPYATYKLVHFLGIFVAIVSVAAASVHVLRGGTRQDMPYRRWFGISHGVAMLLVLTGGFGMLARLGIVQGGLPGWIYAKLAIWVLLGAAPALAYRVRKLAPALLVLVPFLAVAAGALALYKP